VIDHPDYEALEPEVAVAGESVHLGRITPVYPLREGLRQRVLREAVYEAVSRVGGAEIPDLLPPPSPGGPFAGMGRAGALQAVHFPSDEAGLERARRYLALEEFFVLQVEVLGRKRAREALPGASRCGDGALLEEFLARLPFALTGAQRRVIAEVRADLAAPRPMHRLLQGDVGSGKTLVAAAAVLLAAEAGAAAALMAPTQILAEQHFLNFQRWFVPLGLRVELRAGGRRGARGPGGGAGAGPDLPGTGAPPPDLVVGTHALLYERGASDGLGLVVIDEQHKFGVAQREALAGQGLAPDVLVMTATPIPRTLAMTVYGDLDVSVLDELPPGRGEVVTAVRSGVAREEVVKFLKSRLGEGRQAYLVYPLVDESESLSAEAAVAEFGPWCEALDPFPCGLLHGRMSALAKEEVMAQFRAGALRVLVATSVIEVGVDVPNATVMLVFSAERFGLAQLHQLRGRVGRGAHKSHCVLFAGGPVPDRLRLLESTSDGFAVAEEDLRLRGPGEVLGTAQSGVSGLRLGDLSTDGALVRTARRLAAEVLEGDPGLTAPGHAALASVVAGGLLRRSPPA
jgi:ATP-dependent DNA helicase RecG